MVPLVKTTQPTIPVTVLMVTLEKIAANMSTGVLQTRAKIIPPVGKSKISISASAVLDGLEKCVMWKWLAVKMPR